MNISPLRYPGGKTRACKIIDDVISNHFDMKSFDRIVSPFFVCYIPSHKIRYFAIK